MGLEQEYRQHAADSLELASRQPTNADKSRLLLMAEAWLDLADRIARRIKRRATVDHPLVEQVLGQDQPNAE
jgi:hypothetical protein